MKKNSLLLITFIQMLVSSNITNATSPVTISIDGADQKSINTLSDYFYGHNYWMWVPTWGNPIVGTENIVDNIDKTKENRGLDAPRGVLLVTFVTN